MIEKVKKYFKKKMLDIVMEKEGFNRRKMYSMKVCRGNKYCKKPVIEIDDLKEDIESLLKDSSFADRLHEKLNADRVLPHHMLKIAISGCPNGCSRPQIKDIGIIGANRPKLEPEKCISCGKCARACKEKAIKLNDEDHPEIDRDSCLDCGECIRTCPENALTEEKVGYKLLIGGYLGRHHNLAKTEHEFISKARLLEEIKKYANLFVELDEGRRLGQKLRNSEQIDWP